MQEQASPPTAPELELADERRRLRVLTILTLALICMAPFFVYQYLTLGIPSVSIALVITMLFGGLNVVWARRRGGSRAGGWIATVVFFALLLFSNWNSGGFYDPNFGWLYLFPMLAALLVDARAGWVFTGVVLLTALGFWIMPQLGIEVPNHIPPERYAEQSLANRVSAIIAIGILLAAIASQQAFARRLLERANEGLQQELDRRFQMQERLIRTERAASIGSLASGMAHEINNPLTYVIGNLELLQDQLAAETAGPGEASDHQHQVLLAEALEGSQRVASLVRDLKTFSRADEEDVGPVDLGKAIEQSVRLVANEIRHRAGLEVDCEPALRVRGNEGRLQQVLVNLLVNAAHAIEAGSVEKNRIRISARTRARRILLEVSDTGSGIEPQVIDHIFEPLFTTKAVGFGMGMGLSITRNVVESMGGSIAVDSTPGAGSTFSVWLNPAGVGGEGASESSETPASAADAQRKLKILVVDDEEPVLRYIGGALSEHQIVTESRARVAAERILREEYDVILCDLMMPEMTGMDLHASVQEHRPDVAKRMLFMTAGTFVEKAQDFLSSVPGRWIEKPFPIADLESRIWTLVKAVDLERLETRPPSSG